MMLNVPAREVQPLSVLPLETLLRSNVVSVIVNGISKSGFGNVARAPPAVGPVASIRVRPSSWRMEPRFAVPMPTLIFLTLFETVWTRSQPLPVVCTVPASASVVFVQVMPLAASPAKDGLLVA